MLFIGNEIVVTMSKRRKTTDTVRWAYVTARVTSKHEFRFDKLDDTEVTLAKAGFKLDDDREEALCQDGDEHDVTRYYVGLPKITKGGDDWVDRARRTASCVLTRLSDPHSPATPLRCSIQQRVSLNFALVRRGQKWRLRCRRSRLRGRGHPDPGVGPPRCESYGPQ